MDEILGKRVRLQFYDQLERDFYFGRQDMYNHLGDFLLILGRMFGTNGKAIESAIARRVAMKDR